ncbi:MAG: ATP-binding cassette domain-containing protein, partial [Desulfobacterales bacterium]|nr:ATP-binding cassette domain-containing protein [Desulfobacterales bacterium]
MGRQAIIRVKDLAARYGEDIILDHISFDVYEGEIFVVLGGSGCGKSTLLKHLIGLIPPYSGRVIIDNNDITNCDDETFQKI